MRNVKLVVGGLLFSVPLWAANNLYLWDNQQGVITPQHCEISQTTNIPFRYSSYTGEGASVTENLRNFKSVKQSNLLKYSLVKLIKGRAKKNFSKIEVIGVNRGLAKFKNRWTSQRGDSGYIYNPSLKSIDNISIELESERSMLDNISLKVYKEGGGYYQAKCKGEESRNYTIFSAFDRSSGFRYFIGVSEQETALFASMQTALNDDFVAPSLPTEIMQDGEDVVFDTPSTAEVPSSVDEQEEIIDSGSGVGYFKQICVRQGPLNIRDAKLNRVLFKAVNGEPVKVFQSWSGKSKFKKVGNQNIEFVKVQFSQREEQDQYIGWVAKKFIRLEGKCPYHNKVKLQAPKMVFEGGLEQAINGLFPTMKRPISSYTVAQKRFNANRGGGTRRHAGCDLYRYKNEPIRAVTSGKVIRNLYYFYQGTYALEIRHQGGFIARYGEMTGKRIKNLTTGSRLQRGSRVGYMGKVNSNCCNPMLHFELYSGILKGPLTKRGINQFGRREDLVNPTRYLKRWERNSFE